MLPNLGSESNKLLSWFQIQPDISLEELLCRLGVSDSPLSPSTTETGLTSFILVGLHTCGYLGPTLLRLFSQSQRLAGVLSVGCCYMKLSCCPGEPGAPPGDPSHGEWGLVDTVELTKQSEQKGLVKREVIFVHGHRKCRDVPYSILSLCRQELFIQKVFLYVWLCFAKPILKWDALYCVKGGEGREVTRWVAGWLTSRLLDSATKLSKSPVTPSTPTETRSVVSWFSPSCSLLDISQSI